MTCGFPGSHRILVDLTPIPPGTEVQTTWSRQRQGGNKTLRKSSAFHAPVGLLLFSIPPPQWEISSCLPLLFWVSPSLTLSSPIFSNLVDVDDVVSLSYSNFSGIRRKSHALHHIAFPAILRVKKKKKSNEYMWKRKEKRRCMCDYGLQGFVLRKAGTGYFLCVWLESELGTLPGS